MYMLCVVIYIFPLLTSCKFILIVMKNMRTRLRGWHTAGLEPATGLFLPNDHNQLDEVAMPPSRQLQPKSYNYTVCCIMYTLLSRN